MDVTNYLLNIKEQNTPKNKLIKHDKQTINLIIEKLSEFLKYHISNQIDQEQILCKYLIHGPDFYTKMI